MQAALFRLEKTVSKNAEAPPGLEPGMTDLQSVALATWPRRLILVQEKYPERFATYLRTSRQPYLRGLALFSLPFVQS